MSVNFERSFWCCCFDQKNNENIVRISALKVFPATFGLPGILILLTKSPGTPKKLPGNPQEATKNQGRNPEIISLLFWDKLIFHKDIMKSTDL